MNVFEHAMKMEEDGRKYYLDQAEKAKTPALRRILEELANDERKHYNIFKTMRDNQFNLNAVAFGTSIVTTTKTVFDRFREEGAGTAADMGPVSIWEHALKVEEEAAAFYEKAAKEIEDEGSKEAFKRIAAEEHRHYVALDSVIKFLRQPNQYLEDAEWSSLEE